MHPGYQQPGYPQSGQPDNNMAMSIVALLIFWPLGLPAILASSKVNGLVARGDYYGAQHALAESKKWTKYTLITAGIFYGVMILCCLGYFVIWGGVFFGGLATSGG
jgi:Interferon-induced transmembrane protein